MAPAVRQDTKNRLWRPKERETTNDIEAGVANQPQDEVKERKKKRKSKKGKKEKRKKGKREEREREEGINGKAPGKVSDRPEGG